MIKEIQKEDARVLVYADPYNKRIRIDDYAGSLSGVLKIIREEVPEWVEKLIIKSRSADLPFFISRGFACEGHIKGYYLGADLYFVTMYFTSGREISNKWYEEQMILEKILGGKVGNRQVNLTEAKVAMQSEAVELAALYNGIFKVYPTPVGNPEHIKKTMEEGTLYLYIREKGKIVSAASAEINNTYLNAELTDCASLEEVQGKGHMKMLLYVLKEKLVTRGIKCLYTLARAQSFGMNKAFYQLGYRYGGRLINNCFIYSGLEDMNVWYNDLHD